ncbi:MAG: hypothetical protein EXX96DRAFT_559656 [Benjaminiella poitrasii]|nr:MAG: hypothetical protein EXX96DRAFT_559656 [Benjaminiella poitrasii]
MFKINIYIFSFIKSFFFLLSSCHCAYFCKEMIYSASTVSLFFDLQTSNAKLRNTRELLSASYSIVTGFLTFYFC